MDSQIFVMGERIADRVGNPADPNLKGGAVGNHLDDKPADGALELGRGPRGYRKEGAFVLDDSGNL